MAMYDTRRRQVQEVCHNDPPRPSRELLPRYLYIRMLSCAIPQPASSPNIQAADTRLRLTGRDAASRPNRGIESSVCRMTHPLPHPLMQATLVSFSRPFGEDEVEHT